MADEEPKDVIGTELSSGIDVRKVAVILKFARVAADHGISTFADYVAEFAERIGESGVKNLSKFIEDAWRQLRTEKGYENIENAGSVLDIVSRPEGERTRSGHEELTSVKNEMAGPTRKRRVLSEFADVEEETQQEWMEAADFRITADERLGSRLVEEIIKKPRVLDDIETAVLQNHYRKLNNNYERDTKAYLQAVDDGQEMEALELRKAVDISMVELNRCEQAAKLVNIEWGRASESRQISLAKDFSLERMIKLVRTAKNGEALTKSERADLRELAGKNKELENHIIELERKLVEEQTIKRTAEIINDQINKDIKEIKKSKTRKKSKAAVEAAKRTKAAIENAKAKWAELAQMGAVFDSGIDVKKLAALVEYAKAAIDHGISTFAEFVALVAETVGDARAKALSENIEEAWRRVRSEKGYEHIEEAGRVFDIYKPPKEEIAPKRYNADLTSIKKASKNILREKLGEGVLRDLNPQSAEKVQGLYGQSDSQSSPPRAPPSTIKRLFDLNIETVLDHWELEHGLREIIANALDECRLSRTAPIDISKDEWGRWHIRDYGRGIQIEHFTLNENVEKMGADGVIGKFGVGLKDALATIDRHHVKVSIRSPHGAFTLTKASKHNFDGITTLHISHEPGDPATRGTDFVLTGVPDDAIEKAKSMFLCFREHRVVDATPFGQVIAAPRTRAQVFINGVAVNSEPTFLFSYNVTSLTDPMRKALNRERVNIGRAVYADRIRQILKSSNATDVLGQLASAYARREEGDLPEELHWIDIAHKALNELARRRKVLAVSQMEIKSRPELVEDMKRDGLEIVLLSDREKQRADDQARQGKAPFHTLATWIQSVNDSFEYRFVAEDQLTQDEISVWMQRYQILGLVGAKRNEALRILVSETMRASKDETEGVWDRNLRAIIVKRTQLRSLQAFAGTLLHEFGHAITGAVDCTRSFENVLTEYLGRVSARALLTAGPIATESSSQVDSQIAQTSQKPPIVIKGIEFMPVESTAIAGVAYDDKTQTLYVALKKGVQYVYQSVPEAVCNDFLNAKSKGRYLGILFNDYRYQKMTTIKHE